MPPRLFYLACLAMAVLAFVPGPRVAAAGWRLLGILPIGAGVALAALGKRQFQRAGTAVRPFETSSALVTDGLYAWTRNPMYLGMVLALIGLGLALGAAVPFAVPPFFAWLLTARFIRHEEAMLEAQFGDTYRAYAANVRRWI